MLHVADDTACHCIFDSARLVVPSTRRSCRRRRPPSVLFVLSLLWNATTVIAERSQGQFMDETSCDYRIIAMMV